MKRVSLIEYEKPRILAVDFTSEQVNRIQNAGYQVLRASSGVLVDSAGQYSIPCSIHDVDICLIHLRDNSFRTSKNRVRADTSIEASPCFQALLQSVWDRSGYTIVFIDEKTHPLEFDEIGILNLGVIDIDRVYHPSSVSSVNRKHATISFPLFKGQDLLINTNNPIGIIYDHYKSYAQHKVISVSKDIQFSNNNEPIYDFLHDWVVVNGGNKREALCLEVRKIDHDGKQVSGIAILPSFGDKTADVSIQIIRDHVASISPSLFSKSPQSWVENYKPLPVTKIEQELDAFVEDAKRKIIEFERNIEITHENYEWLDRLLIGEGDEFSKAVQQSLVFLGFKVIDVDSLPTTGNAKREDFRIEDAADAFFAIGEAKATKRGANNDMVMDILSHKARYMSEFKVYDLSAFLFINHSNLLEPSKRHDFYKREDYRSRLKENKISAIDSCYLHNLCQRVLGGEINEQEARDLLKQNHPVLSLQK
ncbi:hypothetical protein ACFQI7_27900 [Paenibacillus allorhizosphaerae]|uniref:Restriction endonuclease n=1 Tax=Paenibacillus allorhizosphaerae TaxID=2849866 RepID=A0ABN7TU72_9BACL|nr:hypothetical protein [Paenibacillus allorhizosphaerae]CAG7651712.1 hypothetical protein PAECIP111802_05032 [Paenibacillus allorhizosphaerae]